MILNLRIWNLVELFVFPFRSFIMCICTHVWCVIILNSDNKRLIHLLSWHDTFIIRNDETCFLLKFKCTRCSFISRFSSECIRPQGKGYEHCKTLIKEIWIWDPTQKAEPSRAAHGRWSSSTILYNRILLILSDCIHIKYKVTFLMFNVCVFVYLICISLEKHLWIIWSAHHERSSCHFNFDMV